MPSKTHQWIYELLENRRAGGPVSLEAERAQAEQYATQIPLPADVTETELPGALPGSLQWTPASPRKDLIVIHIHGGGFRVGVPGGDRRYGGTLAKRLGARVVGPAYRLAPENPFPAGLDDCEAAYELVRSQHPQARIVLTGSSAGAGLAASLLLRRKDAGDATPLAGVLFSGVFDLRPGTYNTGSWVRNAPTDPIISTERGPQIAADYLGGQDPLTPYASPALDDLAGLAPLLIQASGAETLLDDSFLLASRAAAAGVETALEVCPGMLHGWTVMVGFLPEADEALEHVAAFVERVAAGRIVDGTGIHDDPAVLSQLSR
ncbi:alpha/beta hydrolase [Streptomyces sp. NPDC000941]